MTWTDTFRTGFDAIRTHRLRSALTMLGILIGIAAVILTVGLGQGARDQVRDEIKALGTNLLVISPGSSTSSTGARGGFGTASTLTQADAHALGDHTVAPDIAAVAPVKTTSSSVTAGSTDWTTSIVGTTEQWLPIRARKVGSGGRFLTAADEKDGAAVAVIGSDTADELFGGRNPVGQSVTVNNVRLEVVGVLAPSGSSDASSSQDDQLIVPLSTFTQRLVGGSNRTSLSNIYVEATSGATLSAAYQEADNQLVAMHGLSSASSADFNIATQDSLLSTSSSVDSTLNLLLAGIAAISLLVGGIGVMNIMLVSVTERIREIGLRKALGARPKLIRRQFLVEASVLGLAGGLLGVGLGLLGAVVIPHLSDSRVSISPAAAGGAIAIAVVIGIVFGVYPASRAARLAPIDALRSE